MKNDYKTMRTTLIKEKNKAKGDEYEELVAQHYAKQGYIVIRNGFIAQKDDKGVDLIAIRLLETKAQYSDLNNNLSRNILKITTTYEIILIQCKRFESKSEYSLIVDTIETAQYPHHTHIPNFYAHTILKDVHILQNLIC